MKTTKILTDLEIVYVLDVLEKLTESSEGYINDGSWLEPLTDDIKNAKQLLKKCKKLQVKELA